MINFLFKEGGYFSEEELKEYTSKLETLNEAARIAYRNNNSNSIAANPSPKIIIVSSPGTGKSKLFINRVRYWLQQTVGQDKKILITSFVKKLVDDLESDLKAELTEQLLALAYPSTLHRIARSIVEKNHGTQALVFEPNIKMATFPWDEVLWADTMEISGVEDDNYSWKAFQKQLYEGSFIDLEKWNLLRENFSKLEQFYNAATFPDLIIKARQALAENPELNEFSFFIVDEYQDLNQSEQGLLSELTKRSEGILVVGDDDQVLYEKLKSGRPDLIRGLYYGTDFDKAMLPFCSRSKYHIVKAADHFLKQNMDAKGIKKIYIPTNAEHNGEKVKVVLSYHPNSTVDFIENFISSHKAEIEQRSADILRGVSKDAYLLILTPSTKLKFLGLRTGAVKLKQIVGQFKQTAERSSPFFMRLLDYYALAKNPSDNFTFRKVLEYEDWSTKILAEKITNALTETKEFKDDEDFQAIIKRSQTVKEALDQEGVEERLAGIRRAFPDLPKEIQELLKQDFERETGKESKIEKIETDQEERAEVNIGGVQKTAAVELLSIVGSKGLSADHVIIIGCEETNMGYITKNAFYVGLTRARHSLQLIVTMGASGAIKSHPFITLLPEENCEFYKYTKGGHVERKPRASFFEAINAVARRRRKS